MIPDTYEAWRHCIEIECGIPLTRAFIDQRLRELDDRAIYSTQQLFRRYGDDHVARVKRWFQRASQELENGPG